jgi:hypothetical protein
VTGKEQYGDLYWCVGLEDGTEVHAHADEVRVEESGALLLVRGPRDEKPAQVNLAFASGQWRFVFAASLLDGHAVAAVHWRGQIAEADPDDWAT